MLTRLHQRLGSAGVALAVIALITALGGTALAASGALSGKQKKEVEKIAKKFAGKPGATGATGPAGTNGTNGKDGAPGAKGDPGIQGPPGQNGTTGFTSTLPTGKTETGDWAIQATVPGTGAAEGSASTAISFNIPLAAAPDPAYIGAEEGEGEPNENLPAGCTGNAADPGAEEGHLCVFAAFEHNSVQVNICSSAKPLISCLSSELGVADTTDPSGAFVGALDETAGLIALNGTWAATAE